MFFLIPPKSSKEPTKTLNDTNVENDDQALDLLGIYFERKPHPWFLHGAPHLAAMTPAVPGEPDPDSIISWVMISLYFAYPLVNKHSS